jgi:glutathione synthase/RimK-type ligase-like ATP-grasp enzyme
MNKILIITRSDDNECIARVSDAIRARGGDVIRLDTDRFPTDLRLTSRYEAAGAQCTFEQDGTLYDLNNVAAIWYRRLHVGVGIPETMAPQLRRASIDESRASLLGLIASLPVFQMDTFSTVRHASIKPLQLSVARSLGLQIPRTLISNDPVKVREFAASCPGGIVAKMLTSFHVIEGGIEKVVFTNPVSAKALERLESLNYSPMTFQEQIPKKLELRVTIVGNRFFVASVDSSRLDHAKDDWRREGHALIDSWRADDIPDDVKQRLLALLDHFQLNYAAMDLILTPDGRHVFLEVNPVGEYFWLEYTPGFPISEAIADTLLGRTARRAQAIYGSNGLGQQIERMRDSAID